MVAPNAEKGAVITTVLAEDQDPPVSLKAIQVSHFQNQKIHRVQNIGIIKILAHMNQIECINPKRNRDKSLIW